MLGMLNRAQRKIEVDMCVVSMIQDYDTKVNPQRVHIQECAEVENKSDIVMQIDHTDEQMWATWTASSLNSSSTIVNCVSFILSCITFTFQMSTYVAYIVIISNY